jgi:hypothetical protein
MDFPCVAIEELVELVFTLNNESIKPYGLQEFTEGRLVDRPPWIGPSLVRLELDEEDAAHG